MGLAASRPPVPLATDPDDSRASAKSIAFYALSLLIQDTKALVRKGVSKKIKQDSNDLNKRIQNHAKKRLDTLNKWERNNFPLAWSTAGSASPGGYAQLLIILNDDSNNLPTELTHSQHQLSYDQLAQRLVDMASPTNATISAPVVFNGAFINALPIAIKNINKCVPVEGGEEKFTVQIFSFMIKNMNIHFLP